MQRCEAHQSYLTKENLKFKVTVRFLFAKMLNKLARNPTSEMDRNNSGSNMVGTNKEMTFSKSLF